MSFLSTPEIGYLLLIEAFVLLTVALLVLGWRYRKLKRRLVKGDVEAYSAKSALLAGLQAELEQTRDKLEQSGTNSPEATRLHHACEFRVRVLEGELRVCAQTDDNLYWQQLTDYFDHINKAFNARLAELEYRLRTYQERIGNLEGFKSQVFNLNERLRKSRDTIRQLESELEKHLPAETRSAELETALKNAEEEKHHLEEQLNLFEREYETLMKNVEVLTQKIDEPTPPESANDDLKNELANCQEENEFLCGQIAVLLKQELEYENNLRTQKEKLEKQLELKRQSIADLEENLSELEKNYLALQTELQEKSSPNST